MARLHESASRGRREGQADRQRGTIANAGCSTLLAWLSIAEGCFIIGGKYRRPIVRTRGPRWITPASPPSGATHRRQSRAELGLAARCSKLFALRLAHRRDLYDCRQERGRSRKRVPA